MLPFENTNKPLSISQHTSSLVPPIVEYANPGTKHQQDEMEKKKEDEEFLKWLSPSYWPVEDLLHAFQEQRADGTLKWAIDMPEFYTWQLSDTSLASIDRILWIRGTLGIGKSIMAAYFVDLLKCQYPDAIVAYFFCRSGQAGLTSARDIIRTLVYQVIRNDNEARAIIEELKRRNFSISSLGIGFLFQKLLLGPLQTTQNEIYIVLDGLDEANLVMEDVDGSGRTEMEALLTCLAKLPRTRLMFISRPNPDLGSILHLTDKKIGRAQNQNDIDSYVRERISKSSRLETQFKNANRDPISYFQDKGNGIFLWVVLVIKQLEKTKSDSAFRKCLQGFSEATGSMEKLYGSILSKIDPDDRKWVKEILQWIIGTEGQLTVEKLAEMAQWCLKDKLADFKKFLEVECGSFLQLTTEPINRVRIVHETFRSFILDQSRCPTTFFIDEGFAEEYVTLGWLRFARTDEGINAFEAHRHSPGRWSGLSNLSEKTSIRQSSQILIELHEFFTADGDRRWLRRLFDIRSPCLSLTQVDDNPIQPPPSLDTPVFGWMYQYNPEAGKTTELDERLAVAIAWHKTIFCSSDPEELFGKLMAKIWLYEDSTCKHLAACFLVALRFYCARENRTKSTLVELQELTATDFKGIVDWAGEIGRTVRNKSLGMAFFVVQKWEECIRRLKQEKEVDVQVPLGTALQAVGESVTAAQLHYKAWQSHGADRLFEVCFASFMLSGDHEGAMDLWERFNEVHFHYSVYHDSGAFFEPYALTQAYDRAIKVMKRTVNRHFQNPGLFSNSGLEWLLRAYLAKGDTEEMVNNLERYTRKYPHDAASWDFLVRAQIANKDCEAALGTIERAKRSLGEQYMSCVIWQANVFVVRKNYTEASRIAASIDANWFDQFNVRDYIKIVSTSFCSNGDYDGAIDCFNKTLITLGPSPWGWDTRDTILLGLAKVYLAMGKFEKTIQSLDIRLARHAFTLVQALLCAGDFEKVIQILNYEKGIDHYDNDRRNDVWFYCLEAYKAKGDLQGAVKIFERAINIHPMEPWLWTALGEAYVASGDLQSALNTFDSASKLISLDYTFHKRIGDIHFALSNYTQSIDAYSVALAKAPRPSFLWAYIIIHPEDPGHWKFPVSIDSSLVDGFLWKALSKAHTENGDVNSAIKVYDSAINGYKDAIRTRSNTLLWFYCPVEDSVTRNTGSLDVVEYKSALPESILWAALGEVYRAKGYLENAIAAFQKSFEEEADNLWLQEVIQQLESEIQLTGEVGGLDISV
jgi:tetratricopeptide (TPR) repeat protein